MVWWLYMFVIKGMSIVWGILLCCVRLLVNGMVFFLIVLVSGYILFLKDF